MDSQGICFSFLHLLSLLSMAPGSHKRPFCIWADETVNQVILLHQEPRCVPQGWNLLPESEWQAPCMGGTQLWTKLVFPKVQARSEGPSKFAASAVICKFLWFGRSRRVLCEARLPWLKLRLWPWHQFPSQGAQSGRELQLPTSGEQLELGAWKSDHREPSGLHCRPLCFFLWAVSSLFLLPLLPCPRYKEEKVSHHFSSTRIKSSPAAVTHPMTVRTLCASGEWGRPLLDAYLRKNFDDSRSYIFLYIERHEKSWTWDVCSLWLAVVFCCSTACFP